MTRFLMQKFTIKVSKLKRVFVEANRGLPLTSLYKIVLKDGCLPYNSKFLLLKSSYL